MSPSGESTRGLETACCVSQTSWAHCKRGALFIRDRARPRASIARALAIGLALTWLLPCPGFAWLFPEHRSIAVQAIVQLDPAQRAELDKLWTEARSARGERLCPQPAEPTQPPKPSCVDYASWPAIAGDHSCSSREMLGTVLNAPWILDVEEVSVKLQTRLAAAKRRDQRINAVRDSNL